MKTKLLIFILLFIRFSCVYGQVEESKAANELEITKFRSHIGYNSATKDSVWNTKNNIHLPSQPTFLSVTVSETNDTTNDSTKSAKSTMCLLCLVPRIQVQSFWRESLLRFMKAIF